MRKKYISVYVLFRSDGSKKPVKISIPDEGTFSVDRIYDIKKAYSLESGGYGTRYTISVNGKNSYLFEDRYGFFLDMKMFS